MFLKALPMIRGMVAEMVIPADIESPTMLRVPASNLPKRLAGLRVRISGGMIEPSSYTECTFIPYSKGLKLSFLRRAASDAFTFLSLVVTLKSLVISICPLTILVEMLRAWKKLI